MNIKSLTLKNIKLNKKKSIATFIAITLSTALIFGTALIFSTINRNSINDAIFRSGDHHVIFNDISNDKADIIKNNKKIKDIVTQQVVATISTTKGCHNFAGTSCIIDVISVDKDYTENIILSEGRYPLYDKEIIIENSYKVNSKYKLNDYIDNYKIVGTFKKTSFKFNDIYKYDNFTVYTVNKINPEINTSYIVTYESLNNIYDNIFETARSLGLKENLDDFGNKVFDNSVINYNFLYASSKYEKLQPEQIMIICIITLALLLTSVFCIYVIYNAFNISLNEKKKYFGMLRSLGATKKHIYMSIKYEAKILSLFSIPLGILISLVISQIIIVILNNLLVESLVMPLKISIYPLYMIMSFIFIIFTIIYSSNIAGNEASKITPVDLIRQNSDIYIKKIKDYKIIKKLFGSSGELAYKNIKRNKHKYKVTVSTLVISFVLFITFGAFTNYLIINWDLNLKPDYDVVIWLNNKDTEEKLLNSVLAIDEIDESLFYKSFYSQYKVLDDSKYTNDYIKYKETDNKYLHLEVFSFNQRDYNKYLNKLSIKDKESVVLYNKAIYHKPLNKDESKHKEIEYNVFKDIITDLELYKVIYNDYDNKIKNENCIMKFSEVHLTELPFYNGQDRLSILLSPKTYNELFNKLKELDAQLWENKQLLINTKDYKGFDKKVITILNNYPSEDYSYESVTLDNQSEYSKLKAIKLVLFSIIGFITVSGIVSVFNIISTNMMLRQREFAMLKSIGLSKKEFNKMIRFESIFLGLKTLFYGIIISLLIYVIWIGLYYLLTKEIIIDFPYLYYAGAIIGIILIIFIIMYYSSSKIKNNNITSTIKKENI